jgi:hypothetical protein
MQNKCKCSLMYKYDAACSVVSMLMLRTRKTKDEEKKTEERRRTALR